MPFVQRDKSGKITGKFSLVQPGYAEEWVDESDPQLLPPPPTREDVERDRLKAYADAVTGSDRYAAEAVAERVQGRTKEAEAAERNLVVRRNEIKKANPWPEA